MSVDLSAKVLIIEDEFLIATDIEDAIEDAGLTCIGVAANGDEARMLIAENRPDFVTLDLKLAEGGSGEALGRELFRAHGLKAVLISGNVTAGLVSSLDYPILASTDKPFTSDKLIRILKDAALQVVN